RRKPWVGKQCEVQGQDRGAGRVRETRGARDSIFEAFLFELVQSFPEREEQGDRGSERGVLLREGVYVGLEIQVEGRVRVERRIAPFREGDRTQTGRSGEAFLRSHHERIDPPLLHPVLQASDGGDSVDDQERVVGLHYPRDVGDRIREACRGFVPTEGDRAEVFRLEGCGHLLGICRRAPLEGQGRRRG